ncbi:MAG: hydroxyethylthiazole kinase [Bacilli bacterium]|jgi:hydroxyethylthiazole kinase|nr:hydroxyethylthiazole kinase [Bacilli bacterium]
MFKNLLDNVRINSPLIHNITNYVTVNDCANVLLALNASPIMADDVEDAREITKICNGLNINIGTLNQNTIPTMFEAGTIASKLNHPIVLDPVGAGASLIRTTTATKLIDKLNISVIRGNISEIKAIINGDNTTKGVDASDLDVVTKENLDETIALLKKYATEKNVILAITGAIDIVMDKNKTYVIYNGHPMMSRITGTGCMLSSIICAYLAANMDNYIDATFAAICTMSIAGEIAYERLEEKDGNITYRNYIIDAIYHMDSLTLEKMAKYEIR